MKKVNYINTAGDMINQHEIDRQIKYFITTNSLKDYYYQIRYTDNDAQIIYACWDEANQKFIKKGEIMASSQPVLPPTVNVDKKIKR